LQEWIRERTYSAKQGVGTIWKVSYPVFRVVEAHMKVIINGDSTDIRDGSTVAELLADLRIGRDRVAVEVGMEIVPKICYDTHTLAEGDRVEIVHFVGGGQQRFPASNRNQTMIHPGTGISKTYLFSIL
jgi:thiamine biosynthesis protein ThiS